MQPVASVPCVSSVKRCRKTGFGQCSPSTSKGFLVLSRESSQEDNWLPVAVAASLFTVAMQSLKALVLKPYTRNTDLVREAAQNCIVDLAILQCAMFRA